MRMDFLMLPGVSECHFRKGDVLIYAGQEVDCVYYLKKGVIYREIITASGNESILSTKAGDRLVESLVGVLIFYHPGPSTSNFIAHTNCICYRIPKKVCMDYLLEHPKLLEDVVRLSMEEYVRLYELFQVKQEGSAAGQLCKFLLEHSEETKEGRLLPKNYTNVTMAKFLSVHKVTVARIIRVLKEEGTVARTKEGLLLLSPDKLNAYAESEKTIGYRYEADEK